MGDMLNTVNPGMGGMLNTVNPGMGGMVGGRLPGVYYLPTMVGIHLLYICPGMPPWVYLCPWCTPGYRVTRRSSAGRRGPGL